MKTKWFNFRLGFPHSLLHFVCWGLIFLAITHLPSYSITNEVWLKAPWKLDKTLEPGSIVSFPILKNWGTPMIRGETFSLSPKQDRWMGVIGLKEESWAHIYGYQYRAFSSLFPVVQIYRLIVSLKYDKSGRGPRLKISDKTWRTMDDKFADEKAEQKRIMADILSKRQRPFPTECMTYPLSQKAKVVSKFASPRTLPNGDSYRHTGVDLRAPTGTLIKSIGKGNIVFASHLIVPGNTVVVDHGGGLFSRYFHLSKFLVKEGDGVKKGTPVGESGATGRVEGPHLHWEVVWKGNHANPVHFLQHWEQLCNQS